MDIRDISELHPDELIGILRYLLRNDPVYASVFEEIENRALNSVDWLEARASALRKKNCRGDR